MLRKLTPAELKQCCDPSIFKFRSTDELEPLSDIIGQERAVRAMEFGLKINHKGYNIFMTGLTGTGKTSYAKAVVAETARKRPIPDDIIYVYNFTNPEKPVALNLPAGRGTEFSQDMENLIAEIKEEIFRAFDNEEFEHQKQIVIDKYQKLSLEILEKLDDMAKQEGFTLQKSAQGIATIPLSEGKAMSQEEFEALSDDERKELERKNRALQVKIDEALRRIRVLDRKAREELNQLESDIALATIDPIFEEVTEKYKDFEDIMSYLKAVKEDIIKNLSYFRTGKEKFEATETLLPSWKQSGNQEDFLTRYRINVFVDNGKTEGAPVVFETNPTYYNLFGKIEGRAQFGTVVTDFTMIRSGAVQRASGGYLILQAQDLFKDLLAWDTLKRVLINGEARVENIGEQYTTVPTITLKPKPLPVNLKVILIGTPYIYMILNTYDEDFKKLFKIKVDFDTEMDKTPENLKSYAAFISHICRDHQLIHFDPSGVAAVVDYSSRLAQDQCKLSTLFNEIVEVLYEASTWAALEGSGIVTREFVQKAVEEKVYRSNRVEEKLFSMIKNGEILVDTEGTAIGQVNGLSVLDVGDYVFGQPSRITATTYVGDSGVINIEREAKLSGQIHDKAVMILSGYMGEKYAKEMPLAISASIAFEQSYGGIEGDSATCAELVALLSSIARVPVRQDLAVTGSLNQHGQVQPVGGTTYKVEGFYHTCVVKGLTGTQGVVLPHQNVRNLMLKPEVLEAIEKGKFHIYSAETIDDVIEIMTGIPADKFHEKVQDALREMADTAKEFMDGEILN